MSPDEADRPIEIAAFGRVSVGKSALLNALFGSGLFAVDPRAGSTQAVRRVEARLDGHLVTVVDTPGVGEVRGETRAEEARAAARRADLVLAVCDQDLTDHEYREIERLAAFGKPLLVVLNKADALSREDRTALLGQIRARLAPLVEPSSVLICAAEPIRHVEREQPDGSFDVSTERTAPDVLDLRRRIGAAVSAEPDALRQVNDAAHGLDTRLGRRVEVRLAADQVIGEHAIGVAIGVALNPMPLLDLFGGGAGLAVMIHRLAGCYDLTLGAGEVAALARELVVRGWSRLWLAALPIVAGALVKSVPFVGWLVGASGQAVGAYYITYLVGHACSEYFGQDRQWTESVEQTLDEVIERTDREAICRRAAELVKARLAGS
jgi:small GTP-binding protein